MWDRHAAVPTCPRLAPARLQARVRAIAEIVGALVQGVRNGEDVDLNAIKREAALKFALTKSPKLVEIIAAVPEEHRAVLLPQ